MQRLVHTFELKVEMINTRTQSAKRQTPVEAGGSTRKSNSPVEGSVVANLQCMFICVPYGQSRSSSTHMHSSPAYYIGAIGRQQGSMEDTAHEGQLPTSLVCGAKKNTHYELNPNANRGNSTYIYYSLRFKILNHSNCIQYRALVLTFMIEINMISFFIKYIFIEYLFSATNLVILSIILIKHKII